MLTGISTRESAERFPYRPGADRRLRGGPGRQPRVEASPPRSSRHRGCPDRRLIRILGLMLTARRHRTALVAAALAAVVALVLTATGTVEIPNLGTRSTDLSDTLGAWTYALVGGLAFLETGAFVGLLAPGRDRDRARRRGRRRGRRRPDPDPARRVGVRRARRPRLVRARPATRPPLPAPARSAYGHDRAARAPRRALLRQARRRRRSSSAASSASSAPSPRSWPARRG